MKNLGSNLSLPGDRPTTDSLSLAMTYDFHLTFTAIKFQFLALQSLQSISTELCKEIGLLIVRMTKYTQIHFVTK